MMFTKISLPIPPSSNKLYASFKGRFIKTKEARLYDLVVQRWIACNQKIIKELKGYCANFKYLHINTIFIFEHSKIVGKSGKLKRLDASNRLKQTHDNLAKILGVDDCFFVSGSFSKATCENECEERVIITITESKLDSF